MISCKDNLMNQMIWNMVFSFVCRIYFVFLKSCDTFLWPCTVIFMANDNCYLVTPVLVWYPLSKQFFPLAPLHGAILLMLRAQIITNLSNYRQEFHEWALGRTLLWFLGNQTLNNGRTFISFLITKMLSLTHQGWVTARVTHTCLGELSHHCWFRQWLVGHLGTDFVEIWIKIQWILFEEMNLKPLLQNVGLSFSTSVWLQNGCHFAYSVFSCIFLKKKNIVCWSEFYWSFFPSGHLTRCRHWFSWCHLVSSHGPNQCRWGSVKPCMEGAHFWWS